MKLSEFWNALETVYGPALGRSLVVDLYLSEVRATATEALDAGVEPDVVWAALIEETGKGEDARWVHRRDRKKATRTRRE